MITYMDQGWCSRSVICGNEKCFRNYNDTERERNENGVNLPISSSDFKTDDCGYKEKK